jgi:asparagine synthase (glutamine-hydrolysing)
MDGIFGFTNAVDDSTDAAARMARGMAIPQEGGPRPSVTGLWALEAHSRFGRISRHSDAGISIAAHGRVAFADGELTSLAAEHGCGAALKEGWRRYGPAVAARLTGSFSLAIIEPEKGRVFLAIDRAGIERLCFAKLSGGLVFATSAQAVAAHPLVGATLNPQAIYDYLYFHMCPSPQGILRGIEKLRPGEYVFLEGDNLQRDFYWRANYRSSRNIEFGDAKQEFRELLRTAVTSSSESSSTASFLSGGTDSSTVVGVLSEIEKEPVHTFSIGFDAQGFDEMEYARCAATAFKCVGHEYYLKPSDIVDALPVIASAYDEPFGNSSAVPTYFCAKLAKEAGFTRILAGDGGDEIFGGNARYAKQKLFEAYFVLPRLVRQGLIEPLSRTPGMSDIFPLNKLRSYVTQANVGLPLRLEAYNFLRRSDLNDIFEPDFLSRVDAASPDALLSSVYNEPESAHYLNRLMHLDWKFTLADNDLRKVCTMTEAAGIEVAFPLLDDRLVAFANQLPVDYKVKGQELRWFFKAALADLLPEKIIRKSKHGFGLPFGVWAKEYQPLCEMVQESIQKFAKRGIIKQSYLTNILRLHRADHANYYGVFIWVVMCLELWLETHKQSL